MPKETRTSTHSYRQSSMSLIADSSSGLRPTTIWTSEDDEKLTSARASGLNWAPIAKKYFPTKTANACRKRHERLMERQKAEDWDGLKLETLAKEYMAVRREMWTILADRLGDKWQVIEQKCMEKGLKNLQAAHRSASRKDRGMDLDSGIGSPDAEYTIDQSQAESSQAAIMASSRQQDDRLQRGRNMSIHAMLSPTPSYSG